MRKLSFKEILPFVKGSAYCEVSDGKMVFHRFTKEQEVLYRELKPGHIASTQYTAGVKLEFITDSTELAIKVDFATESGDRRYFAVDVLVDGRRAGSINNYGDAAIDNGYIGKAYTDGVHEGAVALGEGKKKVSIQFPYTGVAKLCELCVAEETTLECCPDEKKLLAFGDSITQGYDALHPSERYISRLAAYLGAEEYNKGIGGEIFFPELGCTKEAFVPDYITVAYGTNDWSHQTRECFVNNCRSFFKHLRETYPSTPVYVITPIWRKDYLAEKEFGLFSEVITEIQRATEEYENVTVIPGFDLVPHDEVYFADLRLHPNDKGFGCYFDSLKKYFEK